MRACKLFELLLGLGFLGRNRRSSGLPREPLGLEPVPAENALCAIPCSVIAFSASTLRNALRASRSALVIGLGRSNSPVVFVISSPSAQVSTRTFTYCFAAGFTSGLGAAAAGSAAVPRSSVAVAQSPDQILMPLTVPTSLQSIGTDGFACFDLALLGAAV